MALGRLCRWDPGGLKFEVAGQGARTQGPGGLAQKT